MFKIICDPERKPPEDKYERTRYYKELFKKHLSKNGTDSVCYTNFYNRIVVSGRSEEKAINTPKMDKKANLKLKYKKLDGVVDTTNGKRKITGKIGDQLVGHPLKD